MIKDANLPEPQFDTKVLTDCIHCRTSFNVYVKEVDYNSWRAGTLIQKAMPYLSADVRELLISGTCSTCFDEIFAGGEN